MKDKKLSFKKLFIIFFSFMIIFTILPLSNVTAASKKPAKVSNLVVSRTSKSSLKVSWNKASGANGYEIYMKKDNGKYKRLKSLSSKSYKVSKIAIGSNYYFKVRAYKTVKGKKTYGSYSSVYKYKAKNFEYLVDVLSPYSPSFYYRTYAGAVSFSMGGNKYYRGFTQQYGTGSYFNLNGKYSKLTFYLGSLNTYGDSNTIMIYCDDERVKTVTFKKYALPQLVTINVKDTYKLAILQDSSDICGYGEIKLYY